LDIGLKKIEFKSLTTAILTTLLISGTIMTAASSYLTGSAYGQLPPQGDADGDNLSNTWEQNGIDVNNDGTIDFRLPGANPNHKNLYIELDYMENHRPFGGNTVFGTGSVIEDVRRAFAFAPVSNPDGATGINLFILLNEQIPHEDTTNLDDVVNNIKPMWFGTAAERASANAANLLAAKQLAFHYMVFAHQQPGTSSSGLAFTPGMESIVTLGADTWPQDPATNHSVGTRDEQAGTLIHEFGHNLALEHGGNDAGNCEPNYLSVMSYSFQFSNLVSDRPLDYSRSALPTLNEAALNEQNGIGASTPPGLRTIYNGPGEPFQGPRLTATGVPVDFNFNGVINQQPVASNINEGLGCEVTGTTLTGFNDWNNLVYRAQPAEALNAFQISQLEVPEEEQTMEDVRESRLILLEGIDNAISRLGGEISTFHIFEQLEQDQLDAAIASLLQLKAQVIQQFGQQAANREVVPQIDNLIGALEEQKFPSPPPASLCSGTGTGNRVITGTSDPDTLIGTTINNFISGLGADDRINGCAGNDSINGNTDDDGIAGGAGHDSLEGNEGDDVIKGDSGNDQLSGGPGINVLTGGPGRDFFICSTNGETTITDFVPNFDVMSGPCILAQAASSASEAEASTSTLESNTEHNIGVQNESDVLADIEKERTYKALGKRAESD
jgi:RTX calcium-binding nonapeptide repeat (4 copies)